MTYNPKRKAQSARILTNRTFYNGIILLFEYREIL